MPDIAAKPKERFVFIDGLRAVAALAVMLFHLERISPLRSSLPRVILWPLEQGLYGVQIFFVISGFVIAHSLNKTVVTRASATNFILRRQIRLDPTYWVCMGCGLAYPLARAAAHPALRGDLPGLGVTLANMFYLHKLLKLQPILVVSWTLCLEVQFYLLYILVLLFVQRLSRRKGQTSNRQGAILLTIMIPLIALSFWSHYAAQISISWFIKTWYLFALGVLVCWTTRRTIPAVVLLFIAVVLLTVAAFLDDKETIWGVATAVAIYLAAVAGGLSSWLGGRVPQYFGRLSYSLYLVHFDIIQSIMRVERHFAQTAILPAAILFFIAPAVAIGVAHLIHIFVEQPSMKLASRLKSKPSPAPPLPACTEAPTPA